MTNCRSDADEQNEGDAQMRTLDEIKKGLETCKDRDSCMKCTYYNESDKQYACEDALLSDALDCIRQLEAQVPKWISTAERQPNTKDIAMLVVVSGKPRDNIIFEDAVVIGFYYGGGTWCIEGWEEW